MRILIRGRRIQWKYFYGLRLSESSWTRIPGSERWRVRLQYDRVTICQLHVTCNDVTTIVQGWVDVVSGCVPPGSDFWKAATSNCHSHSAVWPEQLRINLERFFSSNIANQRRFFSSNIITCGKNFYFLSATTVQTLNMSVVFREGVWYKYQIWVFFSDVFFVEEVGVRTISDRSVLFFVFLFVCWGRRSECSFLFSFFCWDKYRIFFFFFFFLFMCRGRERWRGRVWW